MIPAFYPASAYGGTVEVAYRLSKELVKRGHEVTVYTSDTLDKNHRVKKFFSEIDGIKVYYFRNLSNRLAWKRFIFNPTMIYYLNKEAKNFDIIHLHGPRNFQNIFAHYLSKKYNIHYVLHAHGSLTKMGKKGLKWIYDFLFGNKVYRDASMVIALNVFEAAQYRSVGVRLDNIVIIPNGIDIGMFSNLPSKDSFKKKNDIPVNDKIVLYLGRINKIKGIDILVNAFAKIYSKLGSVKLVIVGPDDGYLNQIKTLIKSLKLTGDVLLSGPLYGRDKLEVYVDATISVLPSRHETFPTVVLESYACSTPVIASRIGGLQEIVSHGITGLLVKQGAVDELSSALEIMLNNAALRNKLALNAKKYVECNFSINRIVDSLEATYVKILGS